MTCSEEKGELAHRHFPQFKMRLTELPECLESFPSGDSAGAGAFGFSAYLFTGEPLWLLGVNALLSWLSSVGPLLHANCSDSPPLLHANSSDALRNAGV
jgi:hypothetical protein